MKTSKELTITESNVLIADFMEVASQGKGDNNPLNRLHEHPVTGKYVEIEGFNYESDWNLLMPVYRKIDRMPLEWEGEDGQFHDKIVECMTQKEIEDTYHSVVSFILWYNEQKETTVKGEEFVPTVLDYRQKENVDKLLKALEFLDEVLQIEGLYQNQISYNSELIDEVMVSCGNTPDGDHQQEFYDEGEAMSYEDMMNSLKTRIHNMMQTVNLEHKY